MPLTVNEFEFTAVPQTAPTVAPPPSAQPTRPEDTARVVDHRLRAHALRNNRLRAD